MQNQKKILFLNQNNKIIKIIQRKDMFCVSLDTILLINFIKIYQSTKLIIDFGTNNGVIPIILSDKFQGKIIGIEIQNIAVSIALENIKLNNLENKISIIHEDIKIYAQKQKQIADLIICNPPFFVLWNKSKLKKQPLKIPARHEVYIKLEEIILSASKLLKNKGRLIMINSAERINETLLLLKKYQITPKKLQIVYPKINSFGNVFLIEAKMLSREGMIILPPLICHNQNNDYIDEIAKWYKNS